MHKNNYFIGLTLKVLIIIILLFGSVGIAYFAYQNGQINISKKYKAENTIPTITTYPEIIHWNTYTNSKYGFQFRYPKGLLQSYNTPGFFAKNDTYNLDDANLLLVDDLSRYSDPEYRNFPNFALFTKETYQNNISHYESIIRDPETEKINIRLLDQNSILYYLPNSHWFISFPLQDSNVIATGNYDLEITLQILSTFKLLPIPTIPIINTNADDVPTDWKTYKAPTLNIEFKYPPDWKLERFTPDNGDTFIALSPYDLYSSNNPNTAPKYDPLIGFLRIYESINSDPYYDVLKERRVKIGHNSQIDAYRTATHNLTANANFDYMDTNSSLVTYEVLINPSSSFVINYDFNENESDKQEIIEKILSTVKLTNTN